MKAYSIDFREKIVNAYEKGDTSIREIAQRFGVAKSFVQKLLALKKTQGHLQPKQQGGAMKGELDGTEEQLTTMVAQYPDATIREYCEYWGATYNQWVSTSTMCRALQKQKLTLKKKTKQQPSKNRKSPNAANPGLVKSSKSPPEKLGFSRLNGRFTRLNTNSRPKQKGPESL